jgi:hypothetical protein
MQNNTWIIIAIVGVIAIILGYLVAILENRLTTVLKEGRGDVNPDDPLDPDEKPTPKLDEHDVLKVTIDPGLKWHLELDGVRIEPDGLTAEQRTRLVNVVVQIRPWIDGKIVPVAAPKPPDAGPDLAAPSSLVASTPVGTQPPVTSPLRVDAVRGFRSLLENDMKKPEPIKGPSIVGLIDEVLQKKLEGSPLASKRIRLEEGSVGEVVVYVGAIRYSGIDAVPDDDIKAIIREAITEWDKS